VHGGRVRVDDPKGLVFRVPDRAFTELGADRAQLDVVMHGRFHNEVRAFPLRCGSGERVGFGV